MKKVFLLISALVAMVSCADNRQYDLCVYGGSASGVVAAYSAAQMGMNVLVVEPGIRIGGLTTGGLGFTDIGNKQVVKGVALQFYRRLGEHYGNLEQWVFEPSAAHAILSDYINHKNIKVVMGYHLADAQKEGTDITSIKVAGGENSLDTLTFKADWFIDASYEGDLMAKAGVSYRTGREDCSEYGETWNGVHMRHMHQFPDGVDPYVIPGDPSSGLLWGISEQKLAPQGSGDNLIQAYNYRICLTDNPENRIAIEKPENYDPSKYELLLRVYDAQKDMREINQYFIWSIAPNRKTDVNNRGAFSTDMIGMNYDYPEATWEERQEIIKAHKDYTLGLLYFVANDPRVPAEIQNFVKEWGLPKDEYLENDHWTPQLYVRECRRMVGEYVATQADCDNKVIAPEGIAYAAYTMDSHNTQRIVIEKNGKKMVKNEGDVEIGGGMPYPISYRSLTPKREECTNLLVPICCSASHIAYGSIRMEPVFMCMGQASGMAVALAQKQGLEKIQDVNYMDINDIMAVNPYLDGTLPDIIIDDNQAVVKSGKWLGSKGPGAPLPDAQDNVKRADHEHLSEDGVYGPTCLVGRADEGSVEYVAVIPEDGVYDIYTYHHTSGGHCSEVFFDFSDGTTESVKNSDVVIVGQSVSTWHKVTSRELVKGQKFVTNLRGDGSNGTVCADALMLVRQK